MKRKLISAVALILCATMLLFCGCKSKKNTDDSTSPTESGAAVDAITDESTEPSTEGTTEPEKKESTPDAIKKVTDSTKKPGKVNTTTPAVKKDEWKKAGKYTCGKNLAAGEYYIKPDSKNCSVILTDGKHFGKDEIVEFDVLPFGLFVTMKPGYTLEVKNGKFIAASAVEKMGGKNGVYEIGTYRVGIDIPAGEHLLGNADGVELMVLSTTDYFDEDGENGYIVYYDLQYIDLSVADSAENLGKDKVIELASGRYIEFAGLKLVPYVEPKPTEPSSETSSESSSETSSESGSDKDKDKDNDADTPKNNEAGDNNVGDNKN